MPASITKCQPNSNNSKQLATKNGRSRDAPAIFFYIELSFSYVRRKCYPRLCPPAWSNLYSPTFLLKVFRWIPSTFAARD
jgi:hypothetical protein